jgi:hypothetical protein
VYFTLSRILNYFSLLLTFTLLQSLTSCDDFPSKKISIDKNYYLIKTERGYAFTSTFTDLEFFKRRTFSSDKKLGSILIRWDAGTDSMRVQYDSISTFYNVYVASGSKVLLDTLVNFREMFNLDVKPRIE